MTISEAKSIYFIGIGGSSMSGLAEMMKKKGVRVSGSDRQTGYTEDRLKSVGITVYGSHDKENIDRENPDIVVMTDAISPDNPELLRAREKGISVYRRGELLGSILDGCKKTIGVAGTHGKSTTSSLITEILVSAGENPSAMIGAKMLNSDSSYLCGGDTCVFESCEYKESYLFFHSDISVILNIAPDHLDYFHSLENLIASFGKYTENTRPNGTLILNADDKNTAEMLKVHPTSHKTVFFGQKGEFHPENIQMINGLPSFEAWKGNEKLFTAQLKIPGRHNVFNAMAATAALTVYGLTPEQIKTGIEKFKGDSRRFEYHCMINGAVIADDYGHHPDAYSVTFEAARQLGFKRIIAIHQPHTFTRTEMLMKEFTEVLSTVDRVLVTPIYPARENPADFTVTAQDLINRLPNAEFVPDFEAVANRVKQLAQPGDIFITLGCGDINKAAILTTKLYGEKKFL